MAAVDSMAAELDIRSPAPRPNEIIIHSYEGESVRSAETHAAERAASFPTGAMDGDSLETSEGEAIELMQPRAGMVWRRKPYANRPELVTLDEARALDAAAGRVVVVSAEVTAAQLRAGECIPLDAAEFLEALPDVECIPLPAITQRLVDVCHDASMRAGWWINPHTGVDARDNPMCFAQKLCLIHSEISEAMEGDRKSLMDDKLPHRPMREVELADALIRICDLAGAYGMDLGGAVAEKLAFNAVRPDHKAEVRAAAGGKAY